MDNDLGFSGMIKIPEKVLCIEDANKYQHKGDWMINSPASYEKAIKLNILYECTSHISYSTQYARKKGRTDWTPTKCFLDAQQYKTRTEWAKHSPSAYTKSKEFGILQECTKHMTLHNKTHDGTRTKRYSNAKWNEEKCRAEALKYKTKTEWSFYSSQSRLVAIELGIYEDCTLHMDILPIGRPKKQR